MQYNLYNVAIIYLIFASFKLVSRKIHSDVLTNDFEVSERETEERREEKTISLLIKHG